MKIENILNTNESKVGFLLGLIRLAKCNDEIDDSEKVFFNQAAISLQLGQSEFEIINSAWDDPNTIHFELKTNEQKMFFFIEAIQLCWIDDSYDKVERMEIRSIAKELNISEEAIQKVESWVEEGIKWNNKASELLMLK